MPSTTEHQITVIEERLRLAMLAMLASGVRALDDLISSELIFTNHFGQVLCKQDDLEMHRSGMLKFNTLDPSERLVKTNGPLVIVSVRMKLSRPQVPQFVLDPLAQTLVAGAPVGLLSMVTHTRRRNRMNGVVESVTDDGFRVRVAQSFGNYPSTSRRAKRSMFTATATQGSNKLYTAPG